MDTKEILTKARVFVAKGWTQNARARLRNGVACTSTHPQAASWCVLGSIDAVVPRTSTKQRGAAYDALASLGLQGTAQDLVAFNDARKTTQRDILRLFDKAIAAC